MVVNAGQLWPFSRPRPRLTKVESQGIMAKVESQGWPRLKVKDGQGWLLRFVRDAAMAGAGVCVCGGGGGELVLETGTHAHTRANIRTYLSASKSAS
jgi:hypothetical protein